MINRPSLHLRPEFSAVPRGALLCTASRQSSLQRAQFSNYMGNRQRPGKHSPAPPPLYLNQSEDIRYCFTCGRVISSKKSIQKQNNLVKYCSDSCRRRKPGREDDQIEQLIASLLDGRTAGIKDGRHFERSAKGGSRRVISCDEIEELFYGDLNEDLSLSTKQHVQEDNEGTPVNGVEMLREPPAGENFQQNRQQLGQQKAERRERIRRAARRAVVFGLVTSESPPVISESQVTSTLLANSDRASESKTRKCEAVQDGQVVEPSFAKGDFGIRWRV